MKNIKKLTSIVLLGCFGLVQSGCLGSFNELGFNEMLTENYLRHPGYAEYPVVGVSWVQANQYCKWRTDRVNEKILMDKGVLKPLFQLDSLEVRGENNFSTDAYLERPFNLFDGDSSVYKKGPHCKRF